MTGHCEVSLGEYEGDTAICYDEAVVKARKPHKCYECRRLIEKGERYERASGLWEGSWETYHFCLQCSEISREFTTGAREFGNLWYELQENWDEGAHLQACLNRLSTATAKEHMRQRWMKWKGLEK